MSYIVFARKWRPQNFDELIGQEHVAKTLKNALSLNRIAHAYIFCGPRGVGKTSTARILAKALNCQEGISVKPCNKCSTCKEISRGSNLDVLEIDGASNRGIDEIRQLRENIKFSPTSGRFKIYIIDEVHMLTTEAFNALLKTLEEPPEHVKFIFATTQPHKVISTILSRCQRFDFCRIPIVKITQKLKDIAKHEHIKIDDKVLLSISKVSEGSLRDAESILDQLTSYSKDTISLKDVSSVLGLIEQDVLFEFAKLVIQGDSASAVKLLDALLGSGKDLGKLLDNLIEHFRNLMIARVSDSRKLEDLLDLPKEFTEAIARQSKELSLEKILQTLQVLIDAKDLGKRLSSLRITFEIALIKATCNFSQPDLKSNPHPEIPVKKALAAESLIRTIPEAIKNERGSFSISNKKDDSVASSHSRGEENSVNLDMLNSCWRECIDLISKKKMSVATYLSEAILEKCENNIIALSLPKSCAFHKEFLEHKENCELVERTLGELLQAKLKVNFITSEREPQLQEVKEEDSFVNDVLHTFKGRVI